MAKQKEASSSEYLNIEGKLRVKISKMKEKLWRQKDKIISLEVKIDEMKEELQEAKMENHYLRSVVGPDY